MCSESKGKISFFSPVYMGGLWGCNSGSTRVGAQHLGGVLVGVEEGKV